MQDVVDVMDVVDVVERKGKVENVILRRREKEIIKS